MADEQKEIEEMAMSIAECNGTTCENCALKCKAYITCEILHDEGYRKADEVRKESFEVGRKSAAKELLQELFDEAMRYGKSTDGILHMANKYGVTIDKNATR